MSAPPFFIVGFQRSGTTLLRLMLDHHPRVAVPLDTTGLWARYASRLSTYGNLQTEEDAERLTRDLLGEERIRLWHTSLDAEVILRLRWRPGFPGLMEAFHVAYAQAHGKVEWGDKDPGNMLRLGTLNRWFPDARFLHIIRDGRDACLSHQQQSFGIGDPLACANAWREQVWWVRQMGALLGPARYWEVRYEDLLVDPTARLRDACRFLDLEYAPEMLDYHRTVEQSIPDSKRHIWPLIGEPPRKDNAGRWRRAMSMSTRIAFEKRAGPLLRELEYETLEGLAGGGYVAELRSVAAKLLARLIRTGQS